VRVSNTRVDLFERMGGRNRGGNWPKIRWVDEDGRVRFELLIIAASDAPHAPLLCCRWTRLAACTLHYPAQRGITTSDFSSVRTRKYESLAIFTTRFIAPTFSLLYCSWQFLFFPSTVFICPGNRRCEHAPLVQDLRWTKCEIFHV